MQMNEITTERLRRLAALRPERGRVLSVFVNLDPSEFPTPKARSSQVTSLLDEADRRVRSTDGLSHDDKVGLREDLEKLRAYLSGGFDAKGAHALALYACSPADLFEVLKLPRPVPSAIVIDDSPFVEPLAELGNGGRWAVLLVNRADGRILRGSEERLEELERVRDEVSGRHDQGGWSQANYQRSIDKEAADHVKHVADELFASFQADPFDWLLIGTPDEQTGDVESKLHPYLRERIVGRIDVDVEHVSPDDVLEAAKPVFERREVERERAALDKLEEGLAVGGRAAAGLDDVLAMLTERRVGCLLLADGFHAPGFQCPSCGLLTAEGDRCPIDDTPLERREDIVETAIEAALGQSADILVVRHHDDLAKHDSIAALLRF
jgi:peptide subunit release factor 1 (eRF1)